MKKILVLFSVVLIMVTGCFGKAIESKLAKELESKDPEARIQAARKLGEVATPESIRLLLLYKDDPDFRVKEAVKNSLRKIDSRTFLN
jgi:HEAT repeat protein